MNEYEEAMRDAPEDAMPSDEELNEMAREWEADEEFQRKLDELIDAEIERGLYGE